MTQRVSPDGYWPLGMDNSARSQSIHEFELAIFPIWKGIAEKDSAHDLSLTSEEVAAPGQLLYECATLHRQDLAIYRSGFKPSRLAPVAATRQAAGNKYGAWKGGE